MDKDQIRRKTHELYEAAFEAAGIPLPPERDPYAHAMQVAAAYRPTPEQLAILKEAQAHSRGTAADIWAAFKSETWGRRR